ncbi:MAG: mscL [Oscillospiraceae bacterium]|nr:mscL [Oscillospiraceae bacterium]
MKKFLQEFKAFAIKGNVIDLSVAVIIGSAFSAIVTSLVNDLIMPLIGAIFTVPDFSLLSFNVNGTPIMIGSLIQTVVNFLIIAISIFSVVKVISKFQKPKEEKTEALPTPSNEERLLTEIRDILKQSKDETGRPVE